MDRNGIAQIYHDELVKLARRKPVEPGEEVVRNRCFALSQRFRDRRVQTWSRLQFATQARLCHFQVEIYCAGKQLERKGQDADHPWDALPAVSFSATFFFSSRFGTAFGFVEREARAFFSFFSGKESARWPTFSHGAEFVLIWDARGSSCMRTGIHFFQLSQWEIK